MLINSITQSLAISSVLLTHVLARSEDNIWPATTVGGPHGTPFDDLPKLTAKHLRLKSISIGPCQENTIDPLTYIKFDYAASTGKDAPVLYSSEHGSLPAGGKYVDTMDLQDGEYVVQYTGYTEKVKKGLVYKTRLSALEFKTNLKQVMACGFQEKGKEATVVPVSVNRAFLYFSGAAGTAIDNLTGHSIPVDNYF